MTTIYFIRHAEPNYENHDDLTRELTPRGKKFSKIISSYLEDKGIDIVFSSPFKRSVDTIADFANGHRMEINIVPDFRERKVGNEWIDDFDAFSRNQWEDFDYKLAAGESLRETQKRNIDALEKILKTYSGKNIVIGTHGTALSTIIRCYDNKFGFSDFERIKGMMPWIVVMTFDEEKCTGIEKIEYDTWMFGERPDELAALVAGGEKTATSSLYLSYEMSGEALPQVPEYSVLLDSRKDPVCMIRTTEVSVLPFCEVGEEYAAKEGEGDKSLAYWRDVHREFFEREMQSYNKAFDMQTRVVCEEFEVVALVDSRHF